MDAASTLRLTLLGSITSFALASNLRGDDERTNSDSKPCTAGCAKVDPKSSCGCDKNAESGEPKSALILSPDVSEKERAPSSLFVELVSDWLCKSPKFSAQLAIHFDRIDTQNSKPASDLPAIELSGSQTVETAIPNPALSSPMKFRQTITAAQLGEFVSDVIACGHRICAGNKCYEVKDEPVAGTHCDNIPETVSSKIENDDQEEILVVPMAPPAPPGQDIAGYSSVSPVSESSALLRNSGLANVKVQIPVETIVDLLVAKSTLSTRLELTEQLMQERLSMHEQLYAMSERNARLATQLAVTEAKQQYSDALTVSLIERTELAMKVASDEQRSGRIDSSSTVKAIQEDLSNIRRQIALLKKSQPVPFAPSYVGATVRPYVPTAQLPVPYAEEERVPATVAPDQECGTEAASQPSNVTKNFAPAARK